MFKNISPRLWSSSKSITTVTWVCLYDHQWWTFELVLHCGYCERPYTSLCVHIFYFPCILSSEWVPGSYDRAMFELLNTETTRLFSKVGTGWHLANAFYTLPPCQALEELPGKIFLKYRIALLILFAEDKWLKWRMKICSFPSQFQHQQKWV